MTTKKSRSHSPGAVPLRPISVNASSKKPSTVTKSVRSSRGPTDPHSRPRKRAHSSSVPDASPKRRGINFEDARPCKTSKKQTGNWDPTLLRSFGLTCSSMSDENPAPRTEIEDHPDLDFFPIRMSSSTSEPEWYQRILTALPESSSGFIGPKRQPESAEINLCFRKRRFYSDGMKFFNMMEDFNF